MLNAHVEYTSVSRLIQLDRRELLNGDLCRGKACRDKVGLLECCKRLCVKLRFKLLQNLGKLCKAIYINNMFPIFSEIVMTYSRPRDHWGQQSA